MSKKSERNLHSLDTRLIQIIQEALKSPGCDFVVESGKLSQEYVRKMVAYGLFSTTNHILTTGKACRLLPYINRRIFYGYAGLEQVNRAMQAAALKYKYKVMWGGDISFYGTPTYDPTLFILNEETL